MTNPAEGKLPPLPEFKARAGKKNLVELLSGAVAMQSSADVVMDQVVIPMINQKGLSPDVRGDSIEEIMRLHVIPNQQQLQGMVRVLDLLVPRDDEQGWQQYIEEAAGTPDRSQALNPGS